MRGVTREIALLGAPRASQPSFTKLKRAGGWLQLQHLPMQFVQAHTHAKRVSLQQLITGNNVALKHRTNGLEGRGPFSFCSDLANCGCNCSGVVAAV